MTAVIAIIVALAGAAVAWFRGRAQAADAAASEAMSRAGRAEADHAAAAIAAAEASKRHDQTTAALRDDIASRQETIDAITAAHPDLAREYLRSVLAPGAPNPAGAGGSAVPAPAAAGPAPGDRGGPRG